jgi:hypothetical protein
MLSNHRYVVYENPVLGYIAVLLDIILSHKHLEDHIMMDCLSCFFMCK